MNEGINELMNMTLSHKINTAGCWKYSTINSENVQCCRNAECYTWP